MYRRTCRNSFKHFTVLVLAPFIKMCIRDRNSIAKGMLQPITSIDAKNIVRELIANYESGKYDSLIEKTAKEKDFDWSSIYKEERRKSKTENEPQKKQEEKEDASKGFKPHLTENDKTCLLYTSESKKCFKRMRKSVRN